MFKNFFAENFGPKMLFLTQIAAIWQTKMIITFVFFKKKRHFLSENWQKIGSD
jgi:hypothetical protein